MFFVAKIIYVQLIEYNEEDKNIYIYIWNNWINDIIADKIS